MDLSTWLQAIGLALIALAVPAAMPIQASTFEVVTSNDMLAGNPFTDDFYTSSFGMTFHVGAKAFRLQEHMYTDKYAAGGHRFDETWLTARLPTQAVGRWNLFGDVGVVHVGRGLFGQRAQNLAHRLVKDEEMFLSYPEHNRIFASGTLAVERILTGPKGVLLTPAFEFHSTPGFKHHALAELRGTRDVSRRFTLSGAAGYRFSSSDFEPLRRKIDRQGLTYGFTVVMNRRMELAWTKNRFGTGARHIALNFRIPID